jgi:pimeloyl-ACP methyl ester carboxylesterase
MEIRKRSFFKNPEKDLNWFDDWARELEHQNNRQYHRLTIETSLGKTHVWGINTENKSLDALVIFPGARTSALFWDFDRGLDHLGQPLRIFLVETNGLPNPSDGNTPDIKSMGYGEWAAEVLDQLQLPKAFIAGASFGGLICMKLAIVHPEKIKAAFLLNPGCLQSFSLGFKNLYYNLLPLLAPNRKNVSKFLDKAVFCKPEHQLTPASEKLLIDYELFAITRYKDNTQKPYYMAEQLDKVKSDTYLIEGDRDLLFPYQKSLKNARDRISSLKEIHVLENAGHGIETHKKALQFIGKTIKSYNQNQ